jgi:hypothetical protein
MFDATDTIRSRLGRFLYAEEPPYALATIRIVLPLVMLSMVAPRWPFAREIYSTDGATAPLANGYGYYNLLPEFSGPVAVALCTLLLFTMLTACIGWCTRISLATSCAIFTYLTMLDAVSSMTKYTVITTHLLLLLALSGCGRVWSVDAWLARRRGGNATEAPPVAPVWPRRLIQLLIAFIYFGAAITKLKTPEFLTGDQLNFWMLTHINFRHPIGEWLSLYPVLVRVGSYVALIWEITFIFLVWRTGLRPWVLAAGVVFHALTVLTLGLMIFPMVCFCCYVAYVEDADAKQMAASWRRACERWPALGELHASISRWLSSQRDVTGWQWPMRFGFVALGALTVAAGVALEHRLDLYGERRPEGRYHLQPLDEEFAQRLLAPPQPIRDVDKFFAIDTGTILMGDLLADRRKVFRHGERLIAQCNLIPPHEDMWVECKIRDQHNRLVDRIGNVVLREQFRANFEYPIAATLEPGEYTLVFETGGREVITKRIQIAGDPRAVSAN